MQNSRDVINDLLRSLTQLLDQEEAAQEIGDGIMPADVIETPDEVVPDMVVQERPIIDNRPGDCETYPKTRGDARRTGRKYYMMTKPCKNGHFGLRQTHNAQCVTCRLLLNAHFFGDGLRPRLRRWSKQSLDATQKRAEAMASGEKYYESGMPCVNGHVAMRYTSSNGCVACQRVLRKAKLGNFESNQQKLIDACQSRQPIRDKKGQDEHGGQSGGDGPDGDNEFEKLNHRSRSRA